MDSGFYPHPDLVQTRNRIRAWVDAGSAALLQRCFSADATPMWPSWDAAAPQQWHGLMTSAVAAGNGQLSHGFYRGMASDADLVLIQVCDDGHISNASIPRALTWLHTHGAALGVHMVSLSVSGDPVEPLAGNPVDEAVATWSPLALRWSDDDSWNPDPANPLRVGDGFGGWNSVLHI